MSHLDQAIAQPVKGRIEKIIVKTPAGVMNCLATVESVYEHSLTLRVENMADALLVSHAYAGRFLNQICKFETPADKYGILVIVTR